MRNTGVPSHIKRRLVPKLVERDGFKCHYCGIPLEPGEWKAFNPRAASLDHIVPKAEGGTDVEENLVLACSRCNNHKRTQSYEEFRYSMEINAVQLAMLEYDE